MKRIDSSYKLIEFLFGRGNSADAVVNVATAQFRFGAIVLIKKINQYNLHNIYGGQFKS